MGIEAGVGEAVGEAIDPSYGGPNFKYTDTNGLLAAEGATLASGFAGAGVRSLVTGTDFGTSLQDELPNVIGQTIGNLVGSQENQANSTAQQQQAAPQAGSNQGFSGSGVGGSLGWDSAKEQAFLNWLTTPSRASDFFPSGTGFMNLNSGTGSVGVSAAPVQYNDQTFVGEPGDTAIQYAKDVYGDNWRAGLGVIVSQNDLPFKQYGSPIIGLGQPISLPDLSHYSSDQLAQFADYGTQIVTDNAPGIAAYQAAQAQQHNAALWGETSKTVRFSNFSLPRMAEQTLHYCIIPLTIFSVVYL